MSQQTLKLSGALTMQTVAARLAEGRAQAAAADLLVDFSEVTDSDSAALAMLFDWMRVAVASGRSLRVSGLPPGLLSLAQLYGIDDLLPAQEAAGGA